MASAEHRVIELLKRCGVDFTASLPCEKFKNLLAQLPGHFFHVPLTREEEGVGIAAGAALAGKRPALFLQSSGIGNMLNALLSLTRFYELPLALFISQRGIYEEKIAAQLPMGKGLPALLKGAGIGFSLVSTPDDLEHVERRLAALYKKNGLHAFLLNPVLWETCAEAPGRRGPACAPAQGRPAADGAARLRPLMTRYELVAALAPLLDSQVVVCNLGFPAKELYHIRHRAANFYMLGSMGMVTPIGLGISLSTDREVIVIDGDGSLLMNPGTLATAAHMGPRNLTILAIDNGAYGSTGSQPTLTTCCVDLETVAQGFGIRDTFKVAGKKRLTEALRQPRTAGPRFIHCLALPGNREAPPIALHHLENKRQVQEFLAEGKSSRL